MVKLVDLINKGGSEREIKTTSSTKSLEHSSLRHQIEAIKVVNSIVCHSVHS